MSAHIKLGPGREFDAVRDLLAQWGEAAEGVGDDGAVLEVPTGAKLVVSTDSTVEDVHFRRAWLSPEEVGFRATQAALSDLAAMGAAPLGVLLALTLPREWRPHLSELAEGIANATRGVRVPIVGGDVTDGDRLALAITVLGHAVQPMQRSGARPGDRLYVTGALGGPGAALAAWERGAAPLRAHRERFARPQARIAAGLWCAAQGAHAAIDLSDGLAGDVAHLATASGVRVVLDLGAIPCTHGTSVEEALASGEEYELLVAAPALDLARFTRETGVAISCIGRVEAAAADAAGDVRAERDGQPAPMPRSFDHFAE